MINPTYAHQTLNTLLDKNLTATKNMSATQKRII